MPTVDQAILRQRSSAAVHDLRYDGKINIGAILRLCRLVHSLQIDILHCHGYKADIVGFLAAKLTARRTIATCHNWTNSTSSLRKNAQIDLKILQHFDSVVAVSDPVRFTLLSLGMSPAKICRIDNGIDVNSFYEDEANHPDLMKRPVIGVISRLSAEKGIDVLIRALPQIVKRFPSLTCRVVGCGPDRTALVELVEQLGLSDCIRFEGFTSDVKKFLSECTLLVQPSRTEGMPLAVLEAMASRRPIVASAVGSVPQILLNGEAGVLVTPEDPDELAQGVLAVLSNGEYRSRITNSAYLHIQKHFDVLTMAKQYLKAYTDLCPAAAHVGVAQFE
jgi:glycosyltransferase involved in cell wall biosynthesis